MLGGILEITFIILSYNCNMAVLCWTFASLKGNPIFVYFLIFLIAE